MTTTLGKRSLNISDFYKILYQNHAVSISSDAFDRVWDSYKFLSEFAKDKLIYGVNTGFGPMAQYRINDEDQLQLQYNLIRSHCSGLGAPIKPLFVKSLMTARLNTFLRGNSGVHPDLIIILTKLINGDISPTIFEHGSVGASGDLVQLAHLALCLIGEGSVQVGEDTTDTQSVFTEQNIRPLKIRLREGLALMNGTSAMTGIGIVNIINSYNLLNWSLMLSSMVVEIVGSYDDHYSEELNNAKAHHGQQHIAAKMRVLLEDSQLIRKRDEHLYQKKVTEKILVDKVQEYYSIRCLPQILGPIYDTLLHTDKIVMREANSASDNPVIDVAKGNIYHGGNFHGDYVSLEMDKLKVAVTRLSMLSERQLNYLLNDKLNQILPPFVNLGKLGLNLGMQGAQFVATSTTAENQTLSFPMYVHSIPNNNDNQDIVSMGTNSALLTAKVIENAYQVLAVQSLTLIQAIDYLSIRNKLSSSSQAIYDNLRTLVPVFQDDEVISEKVMKVKAYIETHHTSVVDSFLEEENVTAVSKIVA